MVGIEHFSESLANRNEKSHVDVMVAVDFRAVLEPRDLRPRLASGHADEDDLVAQLVLVVKVGGFRDSGALEIQERRKGP